MDNITDFFTELSETEVFTKSKLAKDMIDLIPEEIWKNKESKIIDPCCKSGIFLKLAFEKFMTELTDIEDKFERAKHILKNQLYGIAITKRTGYVARKTLYGSRDAIDYHGDIFNTCDGNIYYIEPKEDYAFIEELKHEVIKLKFDVCIGNPPYQKIDGGGAGDSAQPLYHKFVENAKALKPKYISFIIPARWYSGGKGLDDFRDTMLHDDRISIIHDFPETADCFPSQNIRGGVCYFLWDASHHGDCKVVNHKGENKNTSTRPLLEEGANTFIRYNQAISILRKVRALNEETMNNRVSSRLPFGIPSNFSNYVIKKDDLHPITLYRSDRSKSDKKVYVAQDCITKNIDWKDKIKVLVSKASPGGDEYPHAMITTPILANIDSVCTETYLIIDFVENTEQGKNLISYMQTRFFRFMMGLIKNTQNISKGVFGFVPIQDWSKPWTDKELYEKYNITETEIEFIESMIRPMGENKNEEVK